MSDRRRVSERIPRRVVIAAVAILLSGWVFVYRFNTLGGAFGGFDNDHFLYFALARQVQAGEQPLRDFQDAMHGARPSLTYELSAAAQRVFGNNLQSEAWLTVGGMALGAGVAFLAAALVAPWPWAMSMALLSALLAPKLYGYPKVLVTAVAALIIVGAQGVLTWRRIALMSAWTAVAFLFRHDYAVYCAVGFLALIGLSTDAALGDRMRRAGAYILMTIVLLGPSFWWVQRYTGLTEYVRNAREMSRNEYERTRIGWPRFTVEGSLSSTLDREENAEAWLYYLFLVVPIVVTASVVWRRHRKDPDVAAHAAALVALSLMTAVLWHFFLRGNLGARVGDMAPSIAVLAAYLLSISTTGRLPRRIASGAVATAVVAVTVVCTWQLGSVSGELRTSRLLEPFDVLGRFRQASQELADMPRSLRQSQGNDRAQAADYLHRCTRPADRVIAVGYYPDVPAFSERLFAGGRLTFVVGYYADPRYARQTIAKLESQSVPIVLGGPEMDDPRLGLADYLHSRYDEVGTVAINEGSLRVLVRRGLTGEPSGPNGLPCFG
jgi:hypothetical protein